MKAFSRLMDLQERLALAIRQGMATAKPDQLAQAIRDGEGDTIFAIDGIAEEVLLPFCEAWGKEESFLLIAEGIEPASGRLFGKPGASGPAFRLIVDPVDGSRGLMHDKRSAWTLAAMAPDNGPSTSLQDVSLAVMRELPTSRQDVADCLWASPGSGVQGRRHFLSKGSHQELQPRPSAATTLQHGFATVVNFFPGGKERISRVEEQLMMLELGEWNPDKAEIYCDQYIASGGQLAELILGRDRFVLDIRPLVHRAMGVSSSLCARPYDLCTKLIAEEAGCVVTDPAGKPLDPPLDVSSNVAFVAYANAQLAARIQPMLDKVLLAEGLLSP